MVSYQSAFYGLLCHLAYRPTGTHLPGDYCIPSQSRLLLVWSGREWDEAGDLRNSGTLG